MPTAAFVFCIDVTLFYTPPKTFDVNGCVVSSEAGIETSLREDIDHLDAPKLVNRLPRGQGGGAGLEFMFETHPPTVALSGRTP
jgi:hypothetical protein